MADAEKPKVVEAERFVLRDSSGNVRAEIGISTRQVAALKLYDGAGRCRVELLVTKDGTSGLQFQDQDGTPRVVVYLDQVEQQTGNPCLSLVGKDGKVFAELSVKGGATSASPGQNPAG
jgi:hypothetical protein